MRSRDCADSPARQCNISPMRLACRLVILATLFAAAPTTLAQERVPTVPGIDTASMDLSVRPQDDFFRYVNGKWLDTTQIPPDQSAYGTFAILRQQAQEAVRAIVEEEARTQSAPGSMAQKVGDFYKSYMDTA